MFSKLSAVGVALLALAPSATAHMIMAQPVPYGGQGVPDSSPLGTFPCKGVTSPVQTENKWSPGTSVKLAFTGSAVHGGGSCQISVTKDRTPTEASKWKVIYSIEGGCPGVNGPTEFDIPIPKELPDGEMSMAWTWFNHIGNREMYMNCAPITVSGGASSDDEFNALPDMAVANVAPGADCKTPEGSDYIFENPGKYTTRIGSGPFAPLCGGAAISGSAGAPTGGASAAPTSAGGNNGMYTPPASQAQTSQAAVTSAPAQASSAASVASSAPAQTSAAAVTSSAAAPASSGGSSAAPTNGTGPLPTSAAGSGSAAPASSTGAAATPISSAQASSAPSTPAGGSGTCSTEGQIVCQGETQFGICNHGAVVWQAVAAGTKCQGNAIVKRDFTHRAQRTAIF